MKNKVKLSIIILLCIYLMVKVYLSCDTIDHMVSLFDHNIINVKIIESKSSPSQEDKDILKETELRAADITHEIQTVLNNLKVNSMACIILILVVSLISLNSFKSKQDVPESSANGEKKV